MHAHTCTPHRASIPRMGSPALKSSLFGTTSSREPLRAQYRHPWTRSPNVYMYVCYVCIIRTVHTCCVLTNPPIPSSRCKHFVVLRPNIFSFHKSANPRPPPCNDLQKLIFFNLWSNHFVNFTCIKYSIFVKSCCKIFFKITNHFEDFFKKIYFINGLKTWRLYILYRYQEQTTSYFTTSYNMNFFELDDVKSIITKHLTSDRKINKVFMTKPDDDLQTYYLVK